MIKRVQLVNSTQQWRANGRYKVNTVVTHLGVDYQNTTGANSLPSLLTDWEIVSKELDVYKTIETVVGTWIDGKPIYRKVIISTLSGGVFGGEDQILDVDNVILMTGIYSDFEDFQQVPLPFFILNTMTPLSFKSGNIFFTKEDGAFSGGVFDNETGLDGEIKIIIEYTKTTD